VELKPPDSPVEAREFVQIPVLGLSDADLPAARVEWSPTAGVSVIPAKMWGGTPFLWFQAKQPGKYTITVTVNGFRKSLDTALSECKTANIDAALLKQLSAVSVSLEGKYPLSTASCAVEVGSVNPPVPPPPPTPPTPTTGKRVVILLRETADQSPALARLIVALRKSSYFPDKQHRLLILDRDSKDETGAPSPLVSRFLKAVPGAVLPVVAVYEAPAAGSGEGKYVGSDPCPDSLTGFVSVVQKFGG
jgi:hypothetical protein